LRKGAVVSVLSAISYSSMVVFLRYAYQAGILPGTAIFLRFALASTVLVLSLALSGHWVTLPRRRIAALLLLGFLAYTMLGTTWFVALSITPAWLVSLIVALYPLTVNIGSWLFLKEPVQRQQVTALAAVLLGAIILLWRPFEGANWVGIALMLVNTATNTTYILVGQRWTRGIPPTMSTAWMMIGATGGAFGYASLSHQLSVSFAPVGWVWATLFAVVSTVLAITTFWWGVSMIGAARAAIIGSFEPLSAILFSVLILGERLSPWQMVGGAFILTGVLLVQWRPASLENNGRLRNPFSRSLSPGPLAQARTGWRPGQGKRVSKTPLEASEVSQDADLVL
jgi:drug/metabolite transporter (DMT)-like permease